MAILIVLSCLHFLVKFIGFTFRRAIPLEFLIFNMAILLIGALISINCGDWTWFSRFGTFLVISSILMHTTDGEKGLETAKTAALIELLEISESMTDMITSSEKDSLPKTFFVNIATKYMANIAIRINIIVESEYEMLTLLRNYKKLELITGIFGALVLGFGDLIGNFIK